MGEPSDITSRKMILFLFSECKHLISIFNHACPRENSNGTNFDGSEFLRPADISDYGSFRKTVFPAEICKPERCNCDFEDQLRFKRFIPFYSFQVSCPRLAGFLAVTNLNTR